VFDIFGDNVAGVQVRTSQSVEFGHVGLSDEVHLPGVQTIR
jgi:hypothetical protein